MAEPAGLLKPKLKPVVAADVVAGVPEKTQTQLSLLEHSENERSIQLLF